MKLEASVEGRSPHAAGIGFRLSPLTTQRIVAVTSLMQFTRVLSNNIS